MQSSVRCPLAAVSAFILTCLFTTAVCGQNATDAQATKLFDQMDIGGLYKNEMLDLQELSGDNLKWLQYDANYNNYVEKREFLAGYAKGVPPQRATDQEALNLFRKLDTDGDGYFFNDAVYAKYPAYDIGGDRSISITEFLNGYAKEHTSQGQTAPSVSQPTPPAPTGALPWKAGDAVEYSWNGNWYPATVLGVQVGQYQIHYKDWPEGRFELVPPARVRPRAGQPMPQPAQPTASLPTASQPTFQPATSAADKQRRIAELQNLNKDLKALIAKMENDAALQTAVENLRQTVARYERDIESLQNQTSFLPPSGLPPSGNGGIPSNNGGNSASGPLKINDIVESASLGRWDKRNIFAARIIGIQEDEPKYRLRSFTGVDGSRDFYNYSQNVRRPQNAVYDDYDPRLFIGSWQIGSSHASSTTVIGERDTSIGTEVTTQTEQSDLAYTRALTINGDKTYVWKPTPTQTFKGQWAISNNPDYPITLQKVGGAADWGVGAHARQNSAYNLRVHNFATSQTFWGPPVGTMVSIPPLIAAPKGAASAPASRWKKGDKVEYNMGVTATPWRKVTILDVDNGQYQIHFDGSSSTWDIWADEARLRARQ